MPRPSNFVLAKREQLFVRLLAQGGSFAQATAQSGIDHRHVIRLLDRPDFRPVAAAVLTDQAA